MTTPFKFFPQSRSSASVRPPRRPIFNFRSWWQIGSPPHIVDRCFIYGKERDDPGKAVEHFHNFFRRVVVTYAPVASCPCFSGGPPH